MEKQIAFDGKKGEHLNKIAPYRHERFSINHSKTALLWSLLASLLMWLIFLSC